MKHTVADIITELNYSGTLAEEQWQKDSYWFPCSGSRQYRLCMFLKSLLKDYQNMFRKITATFEII